MQRGGWSVSFDKTYKTGRPQHAVPAARVGADSSDAVYQRQVGCGPAFPGMLKGWLLRNAMT